ncbi:helicase-related protein [Ornithinimicrobium panacihumi]|uniref:helicase-related protein n=1 Tax=Ornithinimicrobium panacihumi TaxID=2008449 RepID=UPI003F8AFFE7
MTLESSYATRDMLVQRLREDLLGGPFDDELTEAPLSRFVVGVLYPADPRRGANDASVETESTNYSDVEGSQSSEDQRLDPGVALSRVRFPRSLGLTFAVETGGRQALQIQVSAARYILQETTAGEAPTWRSSPISVEVTIDPHQHGMLTHEIATGLDLRALVRPASSAGTVAVTLTLINTQVAAGVERDGACWFRPQIRVQTVDGRFLARPGSVAPGSDEEEIESQELLFRHVQAFGVGHGCAVTWRASGDEVKEIVTEFVPGYELLLSDPAGGGGSDLSMVKLSASSDFSELDPLLRDYRAWVEQLDGDDSLDEKQQHTLARHRSEALRALERMTEGLAVLRSDANVAAAFRLMNEAMSEQRSRQDFHRAGGIGTPPGRADARWRPFQLAFILINLKGLVDPGSQDRKVADVLWFPTGGGKTEAYLGIIGIAILLRRLRDKSAAGVSVIMRYTLRLLTLQQYQRAAGLVCALERVRSHSIPDSAPISVGLWVGQGSTPNLIDDAARELRRQMSESRGQEVSEAADPVQLRQCPWCGTKLGVNDYTIVNNRTQMLVTCPYSGCEFRNGLPVHIVDTDVYRELPSLLIATVDKFAMVPWRAEAGRIFGGPSIDLPGGLHALAPDLVVQDELHLISGPLGTIVGLYETAIDALSSKPSPPKLVASTATIRRAREQVRAIFARDAVQFPPPGAVHSDSYFAVEAPREKKGSRYYAGVMAASASHATLMIRVYASLLQSAGQVPPDHDDADLYWTLLGYFNSLRVLGGSYIQVLDDVPTEMAALANRRGEDCRTLAEPREMTSRKKSTEIPEELRILEQPRGELDAADVVLATNMISVGVDVDRLGLMAVMGQPQTSAEYIQATSRVGRRDPGLVVTIYNAARSRDLSHYENFSAYHRALYRHVEATSATPFAARARDRALHAVLTSLVRHSDSQLRISAGAANAELVERELEECMRLVDERLLGSVTPGAAEDLDSLREQVASELDELADHWLDSNVTHYEGWPHHEKGALMIPAAAWAGGPSKEVQLQAGEPPWPTLTSMRNVDAESIVYLIRLRRSRRRSSRES